jgi:formylglycine-generating enzyme required for sulfatase activity
VQRNPDASVFLPTEDEWYKAAYYDPSSQSYFDYPTGTDEWTICSAPNAVPNRANCGNFTDLTNVGSYPSSPSPFGTFDQGGNVAEWTEGSGSPDTQLLRGGHYVFGGQAEMKSSVRGRPGTTGNGRVFGFRLASPIPEPSTGLLVIAGMLGLAGWRRAGA